MACDIGVLSSQGSCLPGRYTFLYTVTTPDGSSTLRITRDVVVYTVASVNFNLTVASSLDDDASAALASGIVAGDAAPSATAAAAVMNALGAAGNGIQDADLVLHEAVPVMLFAWNYSVVVNASVYFFDPPGVHRVDVLTWSPDGSGGVGPAGRRLLTAHGVTSGRPLPQQQPKQTTPTDTCAWQLPHDTQCAAGGEVAPVSGPPAAPPLPASRAAGSPPASQAPPAAELLSPAEEWVQAAHAASKEQRGVLEALSAVLRHSSALSLRQRSRVGRQLLSDGASNNSAAAAAALSGSGGSGVSSQSQGQPDEMAVSGSSWWWPMQHL